MKLIVILLLVFAGLACDNEDKGHHLDRNWTFDPQDLSHIQNSVKNGCFRLNQSDIEDHYLYVDATNVKRIRFSSHEEDGTSIARRVFALTQDGRLFRLQSVEGYYKKDHMYEFEFDNVENIKALKVKGHSDSPGWFGGRQRVDVEIFSTLEADEKPQIELLNCKPEEMNSELRSEIVEAFENSVSNDKVEMYERARGQP